MTKFSKKKKNHFPLKNKVPTYGGNLKLTGCAVAGRPVNAQGLRKLLLHNVTHHGKVQSISL